MLYHNGNGVERDYKKSLYWYEKAAEQGNAKAQENLAFMASSGEGMEVDMQMAIKWFSEAAKQGMPESQYNMGIFFVRGEYVQRDLKVARYYFEQAAKQGLQQAYGTLKALDEMEANIDTSAEDAAHESALQAILADIETKANCGDAEAQFALGCYNNDGDSMSVNYEKAVYWFTKAAEQGHSGAQCNLGVKYIQGEGVEPDLQKGIDWLLKAAAQGDEIAKRHLDYIKSMLENEE